MWPDSSEPGSGDPRAVQREVGVRHAQKRYVLRPPLKGTAGHVFQDAGVAIPPAARELPRGAKTRVQAS